MVFYSQVTLPNTEPLSRDWNLRLRSEPHGMTTLLVWEIASGRMDSHTVILVIKYNEPSSKQIEIGGTLTQTTTVPGSYGARTW